MQPATVLHTHAPEARLKGAVQAVHAQVAGFWVAQSATGVHCREGGQGAAGGEAGAPDGLPHGPEAGPCSTLHPAALTVQTPEEHLALRVDAPK